VTSAFTERYPERLEATRERAAAAGLEAVIVTPGANLHYLVGYDAVPLERITALCIPVDGAITLVVPRLERLAALASPVHVLDIDLVEWDEDVDPYALIARTLGPLYTVGLDDDMTASKVLRLRAAMPDAEQRLAGVVLDGLRQRKDSDEIAALREAGAAIDRVHAAVPSLLRPGRTEAEVGADIAELIISEGHERVDFIIVAAGPNSASPHHAVTDRVIGIGEPIVVDIGGTMPSGYRSDCTRTYCIGDPPADFLAAYGLLQQAQDRAVQAVVPGVTSGAIDAAARDHLGEWAEHFIHRTGHGIGLLTHEEPYIMAGSEQIIDEGITFSVEPGFYVEGRWGARIEDIVVCTDSGSESFNRQPRELVVIDPRTP
jgi:Xaa-Pro aminopeptidase